MKKYKYLRLKASGYLFIFVGAIMITYGAITDLSDQNIHKDYGSTYIGVVLLIIGIVFLAKHKRIQD